jgi:hypothetical protein
MPLSWQIYLTNTSCKCFFWRGFGCKGAIGNNVSTSHTLPSVYLQALFRVTKLVMHSRYQTTCFFSHERAIKWHVEKSITNRGASLVFISQTADVLTFKDITTKSLHCLSRYGHQATCSIWNITFRMHVFTCGELGHPHFPLSEANIV